MPINEVRFDIPIALLEQFRKKPRIIMKKEWAGLWPVPMNLLKDAKALSKLMNNRAFARDYEVVIMRK